MQPKPQSTPDASARPPYLIAIVGGTLLWAMAAALGGRSEPWDAPSYWTVAYPLAIIAAGGLGYVFPERPWRWAVALVYTQTLIMIVNGSGLGLLPLGLIMLGILSLPAVAAASIAARFSPYKTPH